MKIDTPMTFRELRDSLARVPPERLDDPVRVRELELDVFQSDHVYDIGTDENDANTPSEGTFYLWIADA